MNWIDGNESSETNGWAERFFILILTEISKDDVTFGGFYLACAPYVAGHFKAYDKRVLAWTIEAMGITVFILSNGEEYLNMVKICFVWDISLYLLPTNNPDIYSY